jgi:hypothetical protein
LFVDSNGNATSKVVPAFVWIGANQAYVAAFYRIVSVEVNGSGNLAIPSAAWDVDHVAHTNSFVSVARYYKNGSKKSDATYNWGMRWLVNY